MAQPYVGEIRIFAGNFAPADWMFCEGQLLPISENETLFQLIGTTYGGDGMETFALPDLRGRIVIGQGQGGGLTNRILADVGGAEEVTLTSSHLPAHTHSAAVYPRATSGAGNNLAPGGMAWAATQRDQAYTDAPANADLAANAVTVTLSPAGGGLPHENMPPFVGINYIISLFGIFPSPT